MTSTSLSTPPRTPKPSESSPSTAFDIIACYTTLLHDDPSITPPIAAIESLITLLASVPLTTISETLALLSTHSAKLLSSQKNPIPVSAGTELFQRYLISSFQQRPSSLANSDFSTLRNHILTQSSLFVKRANDARKMIARHALPFVRDDCTVVTCGYSRVVQAVLTAAAEANRYFNVIYVLPSSSTGSESLESAISALRALSIPTTTIPLHALPYALSSLSTPPQILLGATSVLENGSIITDQGTHTIALVAKSFSIPLHVCVESYKFVRSFPLGYGPTDLCRMGVTQDVLRFSDPSAYDADDGVTEKGGEDYFGSEAKSAGGNAGEKEDANDTGPGIEITPPELISALITENGIMTPNAVSEELIKLWY